MPAQMTQLEVVLAQLSTQVLCAAIAQVAPEKIASVNLEDMAKRARSAVEIIAEPSRVAAAPRVQIPGRPQ